MQNVRRARRRGNALMEMAIALPVFLLMVFGIFTLGTIYNHQMAINTAAQDGARLAAVNNTDAVVIHQVMAITPNLDHSRLGVAISRGSGSVTVIVEYTERVVGLPPLTTFFNGRKLTAFAEEHYETDWVQR